MLFSGNLHVFLSPQSLDALVIHPPTICDQFSMGARAAKARSHAGNSAHLRQQPLFVGTTTRLITLRVAVLAQYAAGTPLRNFFRPQTTTHFCYRPPASFGA